MLLPSTCITTGSIDMCQFHFQFDDDYFANAISDENWLKGKKKQDKPIDGQDDISGFTSFSGVKETEADEKVKVLITVTTYMYIVFF